VAGVSLFPISYKQCSLSGDYPSAPGAAIAPARHPSRAARQAGAGPTGRPSSPGGGGATPGGPAQRAAGRALCTPRLESPEAAAEDVRSPGRLAAGRGGAPAGAGGVGRPALGGPHHAGVAWPGPGPDADGAAMCLADVSPGVPPPVGAPLLYNSAHSQPPAAPAGRGAAPADSRVASDCPPRWCGR
jgi:hypothetical protein